jgi:hypothetical protein
MSKGGSHLRAAVAAFELCNLLVPGPGGGHPPGREQGSTCEFRSTASAWTRGFFPRGPRPVGKNKIPSFDQRFRLLDLCPPKGQVRGGGMPSTPTPVLSFTLRPKPGRTRKKTGPKCPSPTPRASHTLRAAAANIASTRGFSHISGHAPSANCSYYPKVQVRYGWCRNSPGSPDGDRR